MEAWERTAGPSGTWDVAPAGVAAAPNMFPALLRLLGAPEPAAGGAAAVPGNTQPPPSGPLLRAASADAEAGSPPARALAAPSPSGGAGAGAAINGTAPLQALTPATPAATPAPTTHAPAPAADGTGAPAPAPGEAAAAAAPAPDATGLGLGLNTLPAGADAAGGFRAAVVELLVSGQDLYPFNTSRQALVVSAVNDAIGSVPHSLDVSSIGFVANVTGTNPGGDLALVSVDIAPGLSGHTPQALLPPGGGGAGGASPAPAPSGEVRVLGRRLLAPAASIAGGLVDISQKAINYTVGGSQHVAVNLTLAAASGDLSNATAALREFVTSSGLAQHLNSSGLAVEKVEVVLINYVTPAAAMASPAGGPGPSLALPDGYGASAAPAGPRGASPGVIGGAIAGAVAGTASVLALAYYLSIRKHHTSTRDADPEGKYDTSTDGSAKPGANGFHEGGWAPGKKGGGGDGPSGDLSQPSEAGDTPHSLMATATSQGSLSRIDAMRFWMVHMDELHMQKQIGEGSFGKVYLAKWKETTVAVKVLTSTAGNDDEDFPIGLPNPLLQALTKEAGMMAAMRHPNIVLYLGVCSDPPCVVTEYCARGSLNDVFKRALLNPLYAAHLDWCKRLSMALDAAKGMNYLHTSDPPVIHRDLKSPNLLVDKHWRVKVCDFNLSRVMEESAVLSSMAATNPRWLAPEILGGRGYTFSSDIYSFGIILWEFLTWRVPWWDCGPWQVVAMVTESHQRPDISNRELWATLPFEGIQEYLDLMQTCWAQEATRRPTFGEIIPMLRKLLADETRRQARRDGAGASGSVELAGARGAQGSGDLAAAATDGLAPGRGPGSGDLALLAGISGVRFQLAESSSEIDADELAHSRLSAHRRAGSSGGGAGEAAANGAKHRIMASYGIVFDIDGVILRGKDVIPGAVEAVQKIQAAGIPFCFVTNNGMESEAQRAQRLSASLGMTVPAANMVLNHSGLQEEVAELGDKLVLVTGYSHTDPAVILRGYGFKRVHTLAEFAACLPQLVPGPHERYPPCADVPEWAREQVAAVMIIETPVDWHQDLQIITDLVRTGGDVLGGRQAVAAAAKEPQAVRVYHCNFDFYYMDAYALPRFGPGAFLQLLEMLYARASGRELEVLRHGKPNPPAYACAAHKLARQLCAGAGAPQQLQHIYAIGDNPASDVRGANAAGGPWRSVLVRTGVFHGTGNDASEPAHHVADDVHQAVDLILKVEAERAHEESRSKQLVAA
ncbi:hypothetical protein WJX81_005671 [Elliptochloris bilobata]|uniref:Protein kinase domain-containing protein n=1 Tax=Elliptochloris bilobata TaxID=381761 RepID=A0AAW1RIB6_9CHLO